MSDKPVATFVTALAVAPLCAVCILGPAVVASAVVSIFGSFEGVGAVGVAAIAAFGVFLYRRRRRRLPDQQPGRERNLTVTIRHGD